MDSRHRPLKVVEKDGKVKKSYCNKQFKKQLVKGLKRVEGEPESIDKLRANKNLQNYSEERIVEYVSSISADIQKNVDLSVKNENDKEIIKLANVLSSITAGNERQHEIQLVTKLKSESEESYNECATNNVNFKSLYKFLYSAVSGYPDFTDMNEETVAVLSSTHKMLLEQVEHDATPEFLEDMKSKICAGYQEEPHPGVEELTKIFQDKHLNPLNFPFEYFLNGTLPSPSKHDPDVMPEEEKVISKTSPNKNSTVNFQNVGKLVEK